MIAVANRQNLLDIALQEYGNAKAAFELALHNGLNITDELQAGTVLEIPSNTHTDTDILNFYRENLINPATATPLVPFEGIGGWTIGEDFIVQADTQEGVGFWVIENNFTIQ